MGPWEAHPSQLLRQAKPDSCSFTSRPRLEDPLPHAGCARPETEPHPEPEPRGSPTEEGGDPGQGGVSRPSNIP